MRTISLVYPYYENPEMLQLQVERWNQLPDRIKAYLEFVIVDDGSPNNPAEPIFSEGLFDKSLYRVIPNIPWNQHGARNLGAQQAKHNWLFMSDMDILLTDQVLIHLISAELDSEKHYTFARKFMNDSREPKYHCNTFFVRKEKYWTINGYDEDYCGTYGGDGPFLRQLETVAPRVHLDNMILLGCERDFINDANTTEWDRYGPMKDAYRAKMKEKNKAGDTKSKNPIRFEWKKLI